MKIGLVGEAPNDTSAIQNLLLQKYGHLEFTTLLNRINGSMLDNRKKISRLLRVEYESQLPDVIIFIRDLDALEHDKKAKRKRQETFSYSNRIVDKRGLHLLNIYELEALIVAHIEIFNAQYGCLLETFDDPMTIEMPKEVLAGASGYRFNESHNPEIFALLDFDTVKANCRYFSLFIKKFEKAIASGI
jgi:hypothetical protein